MADGKSKAVLISIHPKWCYKILSFLKHIEVRKRRPKLETPFKCYIYMSSGGWAWRDPFATAVIPPNGEMYDGSQMVVGEFTCDSIDEYRPDDSPFGIYDISDDVVRKTCLENGKLWEYGKGKTLYGWHIADLKIYDKPKCLADFGLTRAPQSWCYVKEVA